MVSAYQGMVDAKKDFPGTTHEFFSQVEHRWVSMFTGQPIIREKGVCTGLCLRWIKSAHHSSFIKKVGRDGDRSDKLRIRIVKYQERSLELMKKDIIEKRGDMKGFGSRTVSRFGNQITYFVRHPEYPLQDGTECPDETVLRKWVAGSVASDAYKDEYATIIGLDFDDVSTPSHSVATIKSKGPDECVMFFDPNGGLLTFLNVAAFQNWFVHDFAKVGRYGEKYTTMTLTYYLFTS